MKLIRRLLLIALLPVAALIGLLVLRNAILARAIGAAGTDALGVETTVETVATALSGGRFEVVGLRAANPVGFSASPVLELGTLTTELPLTRVLDDPLEIERITTDAVVLRVERAETTLNLEPIQAHLDERAGVDPAAGSAGDPGVGQGLAEGADAAPAEAGRTIIVRQISITNTKLILDLGAPWLEPREVDLPDFELTDVQATGDDALAKLIAQVVDQLIERALGEVGELPAELAPVLDALRNGLDQGLAAGDFEAGLEAAMADLESTGEALVGDAIQSGLDELNQQAAEALGEEGAAVLENLLPDGTQEEATKALGGLLKGLSGGN